MRDMAADLLEKGVRVVGVSPDSEDVTRRFCEAEGLTQTVLLDPDGDIARAYGVTRLGGWVPNRRVTAHIGKDRKVIAYHHGELGLDGHLAVLEAAG